MRNRCNYVVGAAFNLPANGVQGLTLLADSAVMPWFTNLEAVVHTETINVKKLMFIQMKIP